MKRALQVLSVGFVALLSLAAWPAPGVTSDFSMIPQSAAEGSMSEYAVRSTLPGWLILPELELTVQGPVPRHPLTVQVSLDNGFSWVDAVLDRGTTILPGHPRTVADLSLLRIQATDSGRTSLRLEAAEFLALAPAPGDNPGAKVRRLSVVNWGKASPILVTCVDARGLPVEVEADGASASSPAGSGSLDLGVLQRTYEARVGVIPGPERAYPLRVTVVDAEGHAAELTLRAPESSNPAPVAWPGETLGSGGWTSYTQLGADIKDQTGSTDPSTGGTTPQHDMDISRGTSPYYGSPFYAFDSANNVFFYRIRVAESALTNAAYSSGTRTGGDPWDNVTWNLMLDTDGDGWKEFNVVLDGDSGGRKSKDISVTPGSTDGDDLKVYYNNANSQGVTGETVSNDSVTAPGDMVWWGNAGTQDAVVPADKTADGATWDFGRSRMVYHTSANTAWGEGYFVDFQFPLDALTDSYNGGLGGTQLVGVNTPIAFGYSTSASNSNPLQKDFASNYSYTASTTTRFPYSDIVTLATGITQFPVVGHMAFSAIVCPTKVTVSVRVAEALQVVPPDTGTGVVTDTVSSVTFQYYADLNSNGEADDGSSWTNLVAEGSSLNPDTDGDLAPDGLTASFDDWGVVWNTSGLADGQYLVRVTAVDDEGHTTTKVGGSYIVNSAGNCREGINASWDSYSDAAHLVPSDYFGNNPPDTVYMLGSFEPATAFNIAYYDSTGTLISTETRTSDTFGSMLASQLTLTTSNPAGTYHSVVYSSTFTPPSTYNGTYDASTNPLVADDTFVVLALTPPIVSSPLYAGGTSVSGSSNEPAGTTVTVYKNGASIGTTTVQADGTWTLSGISALAEGDELKATQTLNGVTSAFSNIVVVSADSSDVTPPPVISSPITAGATTIPGTSVSGATVDVYADGVYLGTTTAIGTAWSLSGVSALTAGTILTATATVSPTGTSELSAPVVVGGIIHMLRSDKLTSLTGDRSACFVRDWSPNHPSMDPLGPNHVSDWGEGTNPQPFAADTGDGDYGYMTDVHSGDVEDEPAVLTDDTRPLVFYQLLDNDAYTLKLSVVSGNIQFTIE